MKFRLSSDIWKKINDLNEKYHILCTEVNDYDELEQFFIIFESIGAEREDMDYVNYVFDLRQLCYDTYESKEEFTGKVFELKKKYFMQSELMKGENSMKDSSRVIKIDNIEYCVDRTFDGSPAVFQHIKGGNLHHINDVSSMTTIDSLVQGDGDFVVIIARVNK